MESFANLQGGGYCYGTCCNFVMSHRDVSIVCWVRRRRRCCRLFRACQVRCHASCPGVPASSRTWRPDCDGSWAGGMYLPLVMRSPAVGVGVSSILIISNTVSGPPGSTPLGQPEAYVDIRFCKSTIVFPARQQNYSSCMLYFNDFECAGGHCGHKFLRHVPCETLDFNPGPSFFQWIHFSPMRSFFQS